MAGSCSQRTTQSALPLPLPLASQLALSLPREAPVATKRQLHLQYNHCHTEASPLKSQNDKGRNWSTLSEVRCMQFSREKITSAKTPQPTCFSFGAKEIGGETLKKRFDHLENLLENCTALTSTQRPKQAHEPRLSTVSNKRIGPCGLHILIQRVLAKKPINIPSR